MWLLVKRRFQTKEGTKVLGQEELPTVLEEQQGGWQDCSRVRKRQGQRGRADWPNHVGSCEHYMDVDFDNECVRKPLEANEQRDGTV